MANVLSCVAIVAITFPISFVVARSCLRGVMRIVKEGGRRDVL